MRFYLFAMLTSLLLASCTKVPNFISSCPPYNGYFPSFKIINSKEDSPKEKKAKRNHNKIEHYLVIRSLVSHVYRCSNETTKHK